MPKITPPAGSVILFVYVSEFVNFVPCQKPPSPAETVSLPVATLRRYNLGCRDIQPSHPLATIFVTGGAIINLLAMCDMTFSAGHVTPMREMRVARQETVFYGQMFIADMALQAHLIAKSALRQHVVLCHLVISQQEIDTTGDLLWHTVIAMTILALNTRPSVHIIKIVAGYIRVHIGLHHMACAAKIRIGIRLVKYTHTSKADGDQCDQHNIGYRQDLHPVYALF